MLARTEPIGTRDLREGDVVELVSGRRFPGRTYVVTTAPVGGRADDVRLTKATAEGRVDRRYRDEARGFGNCTWRLLGRVDGALRP